MSTYYAVVCEYHQMRCDAFFVLHGGDIGYILTEDDELFEKFMLKHAGCPLRIVSEYDDAYGSSHYTEFEDDVC